MDRVPSSYGLDQKLIMLVKQFPILYDFNNPRYMDFNEREVAWQKIGDILNRSASGCKSRWINIRDMNRRILKKAIKEPAKGNRRRLYKYSRQLEFMAPFYRDIDLKNFYETIPMSIIKTEGNDRTHYEEVEVVENPPGDFVFESNVSGDESKEVNDSSVDESDGSVHYPEKQEHAESRKKRSNKTKTTKNRIDMKNKERHQQPSFQVASGSGSNEPTTNEDLDAFLLSIGTTMRKFSPYHLNIAKRKIFNIVQQHELLQIKRKRKNN